MICTPTRLLHKLLVTVDVNAKWQLHRNISTTQTARLHDKGLSSIIVKVICTAVCVCVHTQNNGTNVTTFRQSKLKPPFPIRTQHTRALQISTDWSIPMLPTSSASEMTYIVSGGALNSTHSLASNIGLQKFHTALQYSEKTIGESFTHSSEDGLRNMMRIKIGKHCSIWQHRRCGGILHAVCARIHSGHRCRLAHKHKSSVRTQSANRQPQQNR